jgi:hypothetical protein
MSDEAVKSREFIRGAARFDDLIYVISRDNDLVSQDIPHSSVVAIDQDLWADAMDSEWNATAIAIARQPSERAVLVGEDGDVRTYVGGVTTDEAIRPAPVLIRNARTIDGQVYACGMKRQVYRRTGEGRWGDISAPVAAATEAAGFEAIDGYGANDLYAVGWAGEIWQYDGRAWHERNSPTNVILTAVCCAANGKVYAAGQGGTLVAGRDDAWETVALDGDVTVDIWDLCWYHGKLYVATMTALYTLNGHALVPVEFGKARPATCYSLSTTGDVLWSVGLRDVVSFNGTKWRKYT